MLGVSLVVQSLLGADGDRQNSSQAHRDLHQHPPSSQFDERNKVCQANRDRVQ